MKIYNEKEFNKICADFLGISFHKGRFVSQSHSVEMMLIQVNTMIALSEDGEEIFPSDYYLFHSDWNWIMNVVDKIQYYKALIISINHCEIHFMPEDGIRINIRKINTKEAVIQAIWEFLNWHNKQK